jgi:signal transduction histidine kinase/ActR/RegA family two-component response regulator
MATETDTRPELRDERVLVLAPLRRDGPAVAGLVTRSGLGAVVCETVGDLVREMAKGAGALLVTEDAVGPDDRMNDLLIALARQPAWSELTVLLIAAPHSRNLRRTAQDRLGGYANVVLLERPLRSTTLVSALQAALAARRRQYQIRDYLIERARQERELKLLNETLEQRVAERTRDLETAMRQRAEAEMALRQAQKVEAIGQLTGGIAHDFNNLLMVFSGGLDMLERAPDSDRRERIVTGMRQAAARARALTQQLLAFARKMPLAPEPISFRSLLETMRILVDGALRGDITVEIDVAPDLWPIMADPTQLELAILNLAVNARDAMPQGGVLRISARNENLSAPQPDGLAGQYVIVEVGDTGDGIPPAILHRVFDPFFTTKKVGKGTGLGLSQVYGFATQSGGRARIRSTEGQGTTVVLELPRADAMNRETGEEHAYFQDGVVANGDLAILLVEDNEQVAELASEMLSALGFRVTRAGTAREALGQFDDTANRFDIVFSDVVMPGGMNGLELAQELKRRQPDLPVLLTTGYSEAAAKLGARGDIPLIEKPYQIAALQEALQQLVPRRRAH